ncbi:MAG: hypothetical protein ABII09_12815 [Planctomycetota bacterium]
MRRIKMSRENQINCSRPAVTLMELVIAMALIGIIFAAILPQFAVIRNSWDVKQGTAEALQNGRVLMDHINRNLSKAVRITAVSESSDIDGYIEFEDNDGNNLRYDKAGNNYVEYGAVGDLSDLAGPVSSLTFACYDACDLDTTLSPVVDTNDIRVVKVDATFTNSGSLGQNKSFTTWVYLRINGNNQSALSCGAALEFDTSDGDTPALAQIDSTHYLCAYTGPDGDGWAVVLTVDTSAKSITKGAAYEFDGSDGVTPALSKIDSTHYLCAYTGKNSDGFAVVLTVNPVGWTITKEGTACEYDGDNGETPALVQIDSTHYLCAYDGKSNKAKAVVLIVDTGDWSVSNGTALEYDSPGLTSALAMIDSTHYLCAYTGPQGDGWTVVLQVNTGSWNVSTVGTSFEFDSSNGGTPDLAQIDSTHYLCAYYDQQNDGFAVVLTVNPVGWTITKEGVAYEYDNDNAETPDLVRIDSARYLCVYDGPDDDGWATILGVDDGTWAVTNDAPCEYDVTQGKNPVLMQIDADNYLCAYSGSGNNGYAVIISLGGELRP